MTEPGRISERVLEVAAYAAEHPRPRLDPLSVVDIEDMPKGVDLNARRMTQWDDIMPARFLTADLGDFAEDDAITPEALCKLTEWARSPARRNLVLFGAVGTGKSHAAVAAVRQQHFAGTEVRFIPAVELLDRLKPPAPADLLYELAEIELLVIDDLGAQRDTEWTDERLYALVNRRWLEERPLVVTTNLSGRAEMAEAFGERLFSRIRHDCVAIQLTGRDRRAPAGLS